MSKSYLDAPDEGPVSNFRIPLPRKSYLLRCVDCTFKRSKEKINPDTGEKTGNNPMLERKWEIVSPEKVKIKNEEKTKEKGEPVFDEVSIAGLTVMDWLTITPKTKHIVKADSARLGVEPPDDEAPEVMGYIGKTANAILRTNVNFAKDEETGGFIILPNGEKKVDYQHQLQEWLG